MNPINFEEKIICDNVHGPIGISKLEQDIINTRAFQRLKKIKQLGLASLVFPCAEHSRFAHSIGAMHVMSRMVDRLRAEGCPQVNDGNWQTVKQKLRLAALLHDIGHFPLSHLGEQVFQWIDSEKPVVATPEQDDTPLLAKAAQKRLSDAARHERLGEAILAHESSEVKKLVERYDYDPVEIARIFNAEHEENPFYTQLMSSTLDCDRLDYLLRDSIAAGTYYGRVDVDYLLQNLTWDNKKEHICYLPKAINAIEHFIMARYFSYNITFHKTILGFELLAKALFYAMMKDDSFNKGEFDGIVRTINGVKAKMADDPGFICNFNDEYFWYYLEIWPPTCEMTKKAKEMLLRRQPLRVIKDIRIHYDLNSGATSAYDYVQRSVISDVFNDVRYQKSIDESNTSRETVFVLTRKIGLEELTYTRKYDSEVVKDEERLKLVKILTDEGSEDLISMDGSILRTLSNFETRIARIYALVGNGSPQEQFLLKAVPDVIRGHGH